MSARLDKILFPAWGVAQSVLDWLRDNVVGFLTGRAAGTIFLALSVFLAVQLALQPHRIKERIVTKVEKQIEKATAKEIVRRETVLQKVQVRSARDVAEIKSLTQKLAALQEKSAHASASLDDVACLPADSVVRLSEVH